MRNGNIAGLIRWLCLPLICITLALVSCASIKIKKLSDTIDGYNRALRWGGVSAIVPMLEETERTSILTKKMKDFKNKSVIEYSVADLSIDPTGKVGTAVVQYSCIDQGTQNLEEFGEIQIWKLNGGSWLLSKTISSSEGQNNPADIWR